MRPSVIARVNLGGFKMRIIIIILSMLMSGCGIIGAGTEIEINDISSYEITVEEDHPLVKFEHGIKKTVEFAFEGMDPDVELLAEDNTIMVNFPEATSKLVEESEALSDTLEDNSKILMKTLGSMYNFNGTLTVGGIEFTE